MTVQVTDSVLQAERRARNYWDIDGLATIAQAVAVLLAGFWFLYISHAGAWLERDTRLASTVVLAVLLVLEAIRKPGLIGWLKARTTYPRTGYVASSPRPGAQAGSINLNVLCFAVILAAIWAAAALMEAPWVLAAAAILSGMALWWNPLRDKFVAFDVLGVSCLGLMAALAINAVYSRFDLHLWRFGLVLVILGTLGLLKGIVTLLRYLRRNPVAQA